MKKYNFSAGPAMLPREAIEAAAAAVLNFNDTTFSLMEVSHRGKDFKVVIDEARELFREILEIPKGYSILFLGGGASLQFCMVPFNLLAQKAAYLNTGTWASKAIYEARLLGEVVEVASSRDKNFSYIPKDYTIPLDADYFHITTNNTIYGSEIHEDIDSPIPLVADMSSDIFSRPIDVSKYGIIYGGAQKNLAPAGLSFVIVKDEILGKVNRKIPSMLDYRLHIENESMFNTPPVTLVYTALQTMKWIKKSGGVPALYERNKTKADLLYKEIDRNSLFRGTVIPEDRSLMNACFVMAVGYEGYEKDFLALAQARGIWGIQGHRTVNGFRASIYNAMPVEGVQALVSVMQEFEHQVIK